MGRSTRLSFAARSNPWPGRSFLAWYHACVGVFTTEIELSNEADEILVRRGYWELSGIRREVVSAVVDSGATMLVIPSDLAGRLGLDVVDRKFIGIADGSVLECDVVGPVKIRFGDRTSIGSAISMPARANVLLGALQMEEMDLIIDPLGQRLIPNPRSPDRAMALAVGVIAFGPAPA